jgi:hypothetical protein
MSQQSQLPGASNQIVGDRQNIRTIQTMTALERKNHHPPVPAEPRESGRSLKGQVVDFPGFSARDNLRAIARE